MIKLYTSFLNIEEFEEIFNRYCQDFPSMKKWFFNSNIELLTGCPISVNKVLTCWKQKRIINHYVQNVTKKIAEYNQMTFLAFFFFFFFFYFHIQNTGEKNYYQKTVFSISIYFNKEKAIFVKKLCSLQVLLVVLIKVQCFF